MNRRGNSYIRLLLEEKVSSKARRMRCAAGKFTRKPTVIFASHLGEVARC